jgi:hypothetical protein
MSLKLTALKLKCGAWLAKPRFHCEGDACSFTASLPFKPFPAYFVHILRIRAHLTLSLYGSRIYHICYLFVGQATCRISALIQTACSRASTAMSPIQLLEVQGDVTLEMHSMSDRDYICGQSRRFWVLFSLLSDKLPTTPPAAVLNWAHYVSRWNSI